MTKEILLTQGKAALVDDEDYERLNKFGWYAHRPSGSKVWYAVRRDGVKFVAMHRAILDAPVGIGVDHINGNGLDNQRSNLGLAKKQENCHNRNKYSNNTSGYKGVTWNKYHERWMAEIRLNGYLIYIGYFDSAEDAARAYDAKARELHGQFARTNF